MPVSEGSERKQRPLGIDLGVFDLLWPVLAALALLVAVVLLLQSVGTLTSWSETYGPTGSFTVSDCTTESGRFNDRVVCDGQLRPSAVAEPVPSELVGPRAAFGTVTPRAGMSVDVYYAAGETDRSYPSAARSTELARVIIGIVPRLLLVGGLAMWLIGWLVTRGVSTADRERHPDRFAFPWRFALRPRGALWLSIGLVVLVLDWLFVGKLLGVAGLG